MRLRLAGIPAAASAALLLASCGGSAQQNQQDLQGVGAGAGAGATVRTADCDAWNNADASERLATIEQLTAFYGGPIVGGDEDSPQGAGPTLSREDAYRLIDGNCKAPFARGFKLYKMYGRAAGFQSLAP